MISGKFWAVVRLYFLHASTCIVIVYLFECRKWQNHSCKIVNIAFVKLDSSMTVHTRRWNTRWVKCWLRFKSGIPFQYFNVHYELCASGLFFHKRIALNTKNTIVSWHVQRGVCRQKALPAYYAIKDTAIHPLGDCTLGEAKKNFLVSKCFRTIDKWTILRKQKVGAFLQKNALNRTISEKWIKSWART